MLPQAFINKANISLAGEHDTYVFDRLNGLLGAVGEISHAFGRSPQDRKNPANAWLCSVDRILRLPPGGDLLEYVSKFRPLIGSAHWQSILSAVSLDAADTTRNRHALGNLRSVWGISPIIHLIASARANRLLGIESETLVYTTYRTTQDFDINLSRHVQAINGADPNLLPAFEWLVLLWALYSYDIFFYFNDRGILQPTERTGPFLMGIRHQELALMRKSGKYLYTQCVGSDNRTRRATMATGRFNFCMDCPKVGAYCFCNDDLWPKVFHTIAAYATAVIVAGPAVYQIPWGYRMDDMAIDTQAITPSYATNNHDRNLRIVHVPNHGYFKGTAYLTAVIDKLKREGAPIDWQFLTGITNREALLAMREADVVVDQLIGGSFGLTALEAMGLGKPVVVYLRDPELVAASDECPVINADPDTIYDVLKRLIATRAELPEIGRRSRNYVEKHYSIAALAPRLRKLYQETAGITVPV